MYMKNINISLIVIFIVLLIILIVLQRNYKNLNENFTTDIKISVIILNYKRPHNLRKSIPELLKIKQINEIIVVNGNKENQFNISHPKIRCIDDWNNNNNIYTMRKFKNYHLCKNDTILSIDDDILPSQQLIDNVIKNYQKDKNNFYGSFSRICNKTTYTSRNGPFILTGLFLTSKDVIKNTWNNMKKNKKLFKIVVDQKGNCEDLFFNYEFKRLYKKIPIHITGKYTNLDDSNGYSTTNPTNHINMRKNFCKLIS
jgi:hypothetical protein